MSAVSVTMTQAVETLLAAFAASWDETQAISTFDVEGYIPPNPPAPWIRVTIRHTGGGQDTLGPVGSRNYRRKGLILGSVFTPVNAGRQAADILAQTFLDLFEGKTFGAVECYNGTPGEKTVDGLWYQVVVQVNIEYNQIK